MLVGSDTFGTRTATRPCAAHDHRRGAAAGQPSAAAGELAGVARFVIACQGLAPSTVQAFGTDVGVDVQTLAGGGFLPLAAGGGPAPGIDDVLFLADALAYDHDLVAVVRPSAPAAPGGVSASGLWFEDRLPDAQALSTEMGGGAPVRFRYGGHGGSGRDGAPGGADLTRFHRRFAGAEATLGRYARALRELDEPRAYAGFYSVLVAAGDGDARAYVASRLAALACHDFGLLLAGGGPAGPLDVFERLRARALARLGVLCRGGAGAAEVADHLDRVGRLAGAPTPGRPAGDGASHHGGPRACPARGPAASCAATGTVTGLAADLPLVRALARLALDGA